MACVECFNVLLFFLSCALLRKTLFEQEVQIIRSDVPNTTLSVAMASSSAASSSVTSGCTFNVTLEGLDNGDSKDIAVCVNGFSHELAILHCTASFGALGGPSASSMGFLEWVVNKTEFVIWVQNFVNMSLEDDEPPILESSPLQLKVKPPGIPI